MQPKERGKSTAVERKREKPNTEGEACKYVEEAKKIR